MQPPDFAIYLVIGQNLFLIRIPGLLFQSSGERKKQETK